MTTEFLFPRYIFVYSLISILFSFLMAPVSIYLARRFDLIDNPGKYAHKIHLVPTPLAGGTALILCLVLLSFVFGLWGDRFTRALVLAAVVVYLFGLLDDARGLSALPKLAGQFLAGSILIYANVSVRFIESLSLPFLPGAVVAWMDIALTLFWLVGVTNSMNMIDSKDGIATGLSGIAFLFFILVSSLSGQMYLTKVSTILLGVTVGIYFYNVNPARLFLGDSGSQTLGLLIAAIALEYAQRGYSPYASWFVPILLVGMPIFDTSLVVYSRLRRGIPIYRANLDHTYHRLVSFGLDEQRAVLVIHIVAILISLIAFITFQFSPLIANIIFAGILCTGIVLIIVLDRNR